MDHAHIATVLTGSLHNRGEVLRLVYVIAGRTSTEAVDNDHRADVVGTVIIDIQSAVLLEVGVKNTQQFFGSDIVKAFELPHSTNWA